MKPAVDAAGRLRRRILHGYFVRLHMTVILAAVTASGVLASKGLLELGVHSLRLRYPIAVLASYLVFLGLVRIWIWYVSGLTWSVADIGNVDVSGVASGDSAPAVEFGGGDSGGAGASDTWDSSPVALIKDCDLDLGDDGWWILVLLAALVLGIVCAGGYLIYAAPQILPEAACQAVLSTAFARVSKEQHHNWMPGVLRATAIPFIVVLALATALGWAAHNHCPTAARLAEVLPCPVRE